MARDIVEIIVQNEDTVEVITDELTVVEVIDAGPMGPQGEPGPSGSPGSVGATGPSGVGFTWRGAFSNTASYVANDVVSYADGSNYICILASTSNAPTNPTYWAIYTSVGATGPSGVAGSVGPTGVQGPSGSVGATGPSGASATVSGPTGAIQFSDGAGNLDYNPNATITQTVSPSVGADVNLLLQAVPEIPSGATSNIKMGVGPNYYSIFSVHQEAGNGRSGEIEVVTGQYYSPELRFHMIVPDFGSGDAEALLTLRLQEPQPGEYPSAGWYLPASVGSSGQVLSTDGTGVLSWVSPSSGPTGPTGPSGSPGATGPSGLGFVWRGAYSGATSYVANDIVSYTDGSNYICILASTGNAPTNSTYWTLYTSVGATGPSGVAGSVGATGPSGSPGATGPSGAGVPVGSSGQLQYNNAGAFAGTSGITTTGTELTIASGTKTTSTPILDMAQTWNAGAVTFTGLKLNVTDTASASASLLADLQVGGSSKFNVTKTGATYGASFGLNSSNEIRYAANSLTTYANGTNVYQVQAGAIRFVSGYAFQWTNNATDPVTGAGDTILTRRAAANLRFGAADAASPVAQTLSVQSVVAGTTNTAGANLTITGSQGTGTGAGGSIIFQVAPAGSSGTAQNALVNVMSIDSASNFIFGSTFINKAFTFTNVGYLYGRASGVFQLSNATDNGFDRLQFGGTTSSFPALKRSSTTLQVRLADDSGYTTVDAQHRLQGTAPASATATGTAGDIRYDSGFVYICTASNTWVRAALSTWP